jgi:CTP synthase (UTP-ammonia lyase)
VPEKSVISAPDADTIYRIPTSMLVSALA